MRTRAGDKVRARQGPHTDTRVSIIQKSVNFDLTSTDCFRTFKVFNVTFLYKVITNEKQTERSETSPRTPKYM